MKIDGPRERLSIDVRPEEHRKIKAYAALHGETIRDYVIKSVRERLKQEAEEKELSALSVRIMLLRACESALNRKLKKRNCPP